MNHLVERRSNQAAEPDDIRVFRPGAFKNLFAWDHHAHVDDFIVITGENDSNNILANIVNVAFDGREHNFSLRLDQFAGRGARLLLRLHIRSEVRHSFLHHSR